MLMKGLKSLRDMKGLLVVFASIVMISLASCGSSTDKASKESQSDSDSVAINKADSILNDNNTVKQVTITGDGVRLRQGPGVDYGISGSLNKGDKVEYLGTEGDWVKVSYKGNTLYVSRDFATISQDNGNVVNAGAIVDDETIIDEYAPEDIKKTTTPEQASDKKTETGTAANTSPYHYCEVHATSLRLRTGPGSEYECLSKDGKTIHVNSGDMLQYLGEQKNGFYKVRFNGKDVWVASEYTKLK